MKLQEKPAQDASLGVRERAVHQNIKRKDLLKYIEKVKTAYLMDTSGTYMIIPNIISPLSSYINGTLTLCSQTAANHLHYLKDLTEIWKGPVSMTVFTHGEDTHFALYAITYMHKCFKKVESSVSFHLAYPIQHPPVGLKAVLNMEMHCDNLDSLLKDESKQNYDNKIPYPHNVLRNIAISFALTPYILMIDIDMLPSMSLYEHFKNFIQRQSVSSLKGGNNNEKLAYVIPAFEAQSSHKVLDKQSLVKEWELAKVRPFYENVCRKCQAVTDYDRWRRLPNLFFLDIGYVLEWEDPWEPFYIAKKEDLPFYDGKFKQYGFNRISQVSARRGSALLKGGHWLLLTILIKVWEVVISSTKYSVLNERSFQWKAKYLHLIKVFYCYN